MGDGITMEDLIVHIIQPDLQEIAKVCLERMNLLTQKKLEHKNEKTLSNVKNVEKYQITKQYSKFDPKNA